MTNVEQYLVSGEKIVNEFKDLTLNDEKFYDGYVTSKRILFIHSKKDKIHEILGSHISSMSWEKNRKYPLLVLILGILLVFVYLLGLILVYLWYKKFDEYLIIRGGGQEIRVKGEKDQLNFLMSDVRNQLLL